MSLYKENLDKTDVFYLEKLPIVTFHVSINPRLRFGTFILRSILCVRQRMRLNRV